MATERPGSGCFRHSSSSLASVCPSAALSSAALVSSFIPTSFANLAGRKTRLRHLSNLDVLYHVSPWLSTVSADIIYAHSQFMHPLCIGNEKPPINGRLFVTDAERV